MEFLTDLSWEMKKGHKFILNFGIQKNGDVVIQPPAWQYLIKLFTHLSCDQVVPLLGIYPTEMKTYIHTKTCIPGRASLLLGRPGASSGQQIGETAVTAAS